MTIRGAAIVVMLFAIGGAAQAQEQGTVYSGPQAGEKLPALKVNLAYGKDAHKVVDYIELAEGRPTLLVIINSANRPAANLTRCLMNYAEMRSPQLFAGVIYLDDDQTAAQQYLRQATSWWGVGPPVGVSVDGAEGPGSYGLNRNVNVTVLVADKGRVTSNYALIQPSATDAPKILKSVVGLIGGRVPTVAEVDFLGIPTQKPQNAPWPTAPSDIQFRELICAALAAEDAQQAHSAATAIDEYVANKAERRAVLGNTAEALLNGRGRAEISGVPIVEHLRRWRKDYAPPADKKR